MSVDNVQVNSTVGASGNSYTTAISNDRLTNDDFLQLMLTELKYQDPTKPMDSQQMLQDQMQMSTIETNMATIEAMESLSKTFSNMALSNATSMMGKHVDAFAMVPMTDDDGNVLKDADGNTLQEKQLASYIVDTVEILDGQVLLNSRELVGYKDNIFDYTTGKAADYDSNGRLFDSDGEPTDYYVKMEDGRFVLDNEGKVVITNAEGTVQHPTYDLSEDTTIPRFGYTGSEEVYSPQSTPLKYENVQKIYNS
jgi:flagellar basal-body rod modification protein FlgD